MSTDALFEPGLIERLVMQYPDRDVPSIASDVRDMARRGVVQNPNGLLISRCRRAESENAWRRDAIGRPAADPLTPYWRAEEVHRRYAMAVAHAMSMARWLSPNDIADLLETYARSEEYRLMNPALLAILREWGSQWPSGAEEAPETSCAPEEPPAVVGQ